MHFNLYFMNKNTHYTHSYIVMNFHLLSTYPKLINISFPHVNYQHIVYPWVFFWVYIIKYLMQNAWQDKHTNMILMGLGLKRVFKRPCCKLGWRQKNNTKANWWSCSLLLILLQEMISLPKLSYINHVSKLVIDKRKWNGYKFGTETKQSKINFFFHLVQ